jgi:aryl-alcohol dehydrogenase-like predicted oxidoreductase
MRITGPGIWGPPDDPTEALLTLRLLRELGINFIDTADSYGPAVSEQLIREALHPYGEQIVATKGGLRRGGPDQWIVDGRPERLTEQVHKSLQNLGLEQIPLWQLHRVDPRVPRDEQFGAIRTMIDEGLIKLAGLSEVSIDDIEAASRYFRVSTVQNRYNLFDRQSEDVLDYCERHGIAFIPWYPLSAGNLANERSVLADIAQRLGAKPAQIAVAWLLRRSPVMLPIPGTSKRHHLRENVAAGSITLSDNEFEALDALGRNRT